MHPKATEYTKNITLGDKGLILGEKVEGFLVHVLFGFVVGLFFFLGVRRKESE